jgi:hypothetical protein
MTPIIIKTEEAVKKYNIRKGKGSQTHLFDSEVNLRIGHTRQTLLKS